MITVYSRRKLHEREQVCPEVCLSGTADQSYSSLWIRSHKTSSAWKTVSQLKTEVCSLKVFHEAFQDQNELLRQWHRGGGKVKVTKCSRTYNQETVPNSKMSSVTLLSDLIGWLWLLHSGNQLLTVNRLVTAAVGWAAYCVNTTCLLWCQLWISVARHNVLFNSDNQMKLKKWSSSNKNIK